MMRYFPPLVLAALLAACASSPVSTPEPLWAGNVEAMYPQSQWVTGLGEGVNRSAAENAALGRLALRFDTNVEALLQTSQLWRETVQELNGSRTVALHENAEALETVYTSSSVSGLIGVEFDYWNGPGSTVQACARMNRSECTARYTALINENETVIQQIITEAASSSPLAAYKRLNYALRLAELSDGFYTIRGVLTPGLGVSRPRYGGVEALKTLAQAAAGKVVINISVTGDVDSRIEKAYAAFFTGLGFKTGSGGYVFNAGLELQNTDFDNPRYKYIRYVLNASLEDGGGKEVFAFSANGREGHLSESEARQRAVRAAEESIASGAFAQDFGAYLSSML